LLKGRVYPVDLWEIVWERIVEAKQETVLREHQSICVGAFNGKRHAAAEHILMEEKKKRGQMEVSLYSQALEHLQQHQMRELLQLWLNQLSELQSIILYVQLIGTSGLRQQPQSTL
jgi:hypothetical protein